MTELFDMELLEDRAADLEGRGYNGISRIFVTLNAAADPAYAILDVEFFNDLFLAAILDKINVQGVAPVDIFSIKGGSRIPAGSGPGRVQVTAVAAGSGSKYLQLRVLPIGDYSTYGLMVSHRDVVLDTNGNPVLNGDGTPLLESKIDPLFAEKKFKFRPGCFNSNCAPVGKQEPTTGEPVIDYLAKDFDSFKHVLINAMQVRVPNWQPTSEADLDQVLIDLIAADADELSDFQDRVMNEAYLGRARKRVSLARHARLMDYHIHQGNQASTRLALKMVADDNIPRGFGVWTGEKWQDEDEVVFVSTHDQQCFAALNELHLYTWNGIVTALETGSVEADLLPPGGTTKTAAEELLTLLRRDDIRMLSIEEKLNPETGGQNGRDKTARQLLRLRNGAQAAALVHDPVEDAWLVRVYWQEQDKLTRRYCFVTQCPAQPSLEGVSAFCGNLIEVTHGRPHRTTFKPPGTPLNPTDNSGLVHTGEVWFELPPEKRWGTQCPLPLALLAYRNTEPGGDQPPKSTLEVEVSGFSRLWEEQKDLIESESGDTHFVVETDEYDRSTIRFGNNINGRGLDSDARVICRYQVGRGSVGNIGADTLTGFDNSASGYPNVKEVWNPFDVTDGRDPEEPAVIIRRVPQAFRSKQLRAVTLEDYAKRAEQLPGVSHAKARYSWTGSWRTVRVAIDPKGTDRLSEELRRKVERHLDAVRLIGEDLEVRGARYVALDIFVKLCVHSDYWPEDLAYELEREFSDDYTADGRQGFFHPDLWTFGQPVYSSQLIGRALSVTGVERVLLVSMRRRHSGSGVGATVVTINPEDMVHEETGVLNVDPFEVIQVANDPNHLEKGSLQFDLAGGRQ